jgi:hypothetical protein
MGTVLAEAGVEKRLIQELLGHSGTRISERYTKPRRPALRRAALKATRLMGVDTLCLPSDLSGGQASPGAPGCAPWRATSKRTWRWLRKFRSIARAPRCGHAPVLACSPTLPSGRFVLTTHRKNAPFRSSQKDRVTTWTGQSSDTPKRTQVDFICRTCWYRRPIEVQKGPRPPPLPRSESAVQQTSSDD